jgi:hypothetical protein
VNVGLRLGALAQSQRFDHGWQLLAQTYSAHVAAPDNVVASLASGHTDDQFETYTPMYLSYPLID